MFRAIALRDSGLVLGAFALWIAVVFLLNPETPIGFYGSWAVVVGLFVGLLLSHQPLFRLTARPIVGGLLRAVFSFVVWVVALLFCAMVYITVVPALR